MLLRGFLRKMNRRQTENEKQLPRNRAPAKRIDDMVTLRGMASSYDLFPMPRNPAHDQFNLRIVLEATGNRPFVPRVSDKAECASI